jgi:la-related protein 1
MSQKEFDRTLADLRVAGHFNELRYIGAHDIVIRHRASVGIGNSQAFVALAHFWSYYLRDNFDQSMYNEFLLLAREDLSHGDSYPIQCYFRFWSYGLETRWDAAVFADFQREAMVLFETGDTYGIEKVKGFMEHHRFEFPIRLNEEVERALAQFPTLQSFEAGAQPRQPPPLPNRGRGRARGGQRGARRPRQQPQEEPRTWVFGRAQPASAPSADSPMRNGWRR